MILDATEMVGTSDAVVRLDATALSAAIRSRALSCREVMEAHLARIEAVNGQANAIVSLRDASALLAEADAADRDLAQGRWRGPLHGFPHAVKDLAATRGLRTTFGSPLFRDHVPQEDAVFVERLRAAGAILIGKTNVPEFGLGSNTYNPVFGSTCNAFDPSRSCGGSSGGAAVALALHMLPLADGSDFGGSLRNPAGWNGVFGFRPSAGRVPALPYPEAYLQQLSTDGPMARTVDDLALLLSVMSGWDARAPLAIAQPPLPASLPEFDVAGRRIGWLASFAESLPMEDGIIPLTVSALGAFEQAGCIVEEASLGLSREAIWACWLVWRHALMAGKFGSSYADPAKRALMKPELLFEIEGGLQLSATDLFDAATGRTALYQAFLALFSRYDAIALPSAQVFPFPRELDWPHEIAGQTMDSYHRWMEVMMPGTLSGCPVICVPAGLGGADDLPSGVQLIGRPGADLELLALAKAFEQVSRPKDRLPR